jgi:hypothetical protein
VEPTASTPEQNLYPEDRNCSFLRKVDTHPICETTRRHIRKERVILMFTLVNNSLITHDEKDNLTSERGSTVEMDRVKTLGTSLYVILLY